MMEAPPREQTLVTQFLESLREVPGVRPDLRRVESKPGEDAPGCDAQVNLHVGGRSLTLRVEVKKSIYPRDVRQILWQLKGQNRPWHSSNSETQTVLAAEAISPGAKELLRAEQVGYFDSGGSLFLPARGAYLYIDKPPPKALERSVRSIFSGRRARVLHALLAHPRDWFGVTEIAQEAGVAPSTASEVLSQLDRFECLTSRGQGAGKERQLREPGELLDTWAKQQALVRAPVMRRYYVPGVQPDALLAQLADKFDSRQIEYAVSYEAAAQRYAPFLSCVSQVRVRVPVILQAEAVIAELDARSVTEGSNLAVVATNSSGELLFREKIGGIWLASPVQVYLDLLRSEGRAKELAEHLRKERIGI
ncbi:MAG TPA: helix-turn-helix domain-containing protein [Steroidobacteraceae bacterium]|nr:helix-turn-helix domain-containing protein [Steroidobacteraceae bacterium]